jgi:phage baseplate assembly protein W
MTTKAISSSHSDLNPRIGEIGQPPILKGDAAVRAALKNLLSSYVGCRSRTFNQTWGSGIMNLLQEPMTEVTAARLRAEIISTVTTWEPRVTVLNYETSVDIDYNKARYNVKLVYRVNALGSISTYNLSLEP